MLNLVLAGHKCERDSPKDHPCQVWFNLVQWFERNLNVKAYDVRQTDDDRLLSPNDGKLATYDKRTMTDDCRQMMESLRRTTNRQLSPNDGKLTMYNEQTTVAE